MSAAPAPCSMDFGFERLGIRSGTDLYYLEENTHFAKVTDTDLGPVIDMLWIDGYFMTTDGENIIVTELNNPTSVLPLKYGSAEEDPDMVTGLIKARNEAYALGQYTIQVFQNVGGSGFPFQTVKGASIPVGCVGPSAKCLFADSFAFVGSSRNEALGVYLAGSGTATRISSRDVDDELAKVTDPSDIILENRTSRAERRLLVHLPDKTLVFLMNASKILGEPVWYVAQSGSGEPYRIRNAVALLRQDLCRGCFGQPPWRAYGQRFNPFRRPCRVAVRCRAALQPGEGRHRQFDRAGGASRQSASGS
jgi:hypothetical protein